MDAYLKRCNNLVLNKYCILIYSTTYNMHHLNIHPTIMSQVVLVGWWVLSSSPIFTTMYLYYQLLTLPHNENL